MKFRAKTEDIRNFVKLKSGESVQGVFRGDPFDFRIHWINEEQRTVLCTGPATCDLCRAKKKSTFRFRINFIVPEGDGYTVKILEQGWNSYQALINLQESGYDLEKQIIQITRQGTGLNTSHSIIPSPRGLITPDKEKIFAQLKMNDLGHVTEAENEPAEVPPALTDDDIPF